MGRGNFYIQDGAVVYIDQEQIEEEFGFQDLLSNLSSILNDKKKMFYDHNHWDRNVHYYYESDLLKVGLADNETSTAVVFKPRERVDGEMDKRAFPVIRKIIKQLMERYDLSGRSGPWSSFKVEQPQQVI